MSGYLLALAVIGAMSALTFEVYRMDKKRAAHNGRRVSENTLHLLSLLGGWPGAFAAQRLLRHKTRKPAFLALFWFTSALNIILLLCLSTPLGERALQTLFHLAGRPPR